MTTLDVRAFEETVATRDLLRFMTAGSVDDGKSTLIGRLLYDSGHLHSDQYESIRTAEGVDFSRVTDGLTAEREQGITIDVAHRYFATERRAFIIADAPGHEQHTRNMATAASTAQLALLLVDATRGVVRQTRRHAFIASLLGIPRLLVVVNKMDRVDWSEECFESIRRDFSLFAQRLSQVDLRFIPVCALDGDNVARRSERMPWYSGESVLEHLENVYVGSDRNLIDFRYPVQYVQRGNGGERFLCGQIDSGRIRNGEEVVVLPSGVRSRVADIVALGEDRYEACAGQSVALRLADDIDVQRGDLIVRPNNRPHVSTALEAMIVWMTAAPLRVAHRYRLLHGTRDVAAVVRDLRYRVDVDTLSRETVPALGLNDIGRASIETLEPLCFDAYRALPGTGSFVLVDEDDHETVACGMITDRIGESRPTTPAARNITPSAPSLVSGEERAARLGHRPLTLWFTGLSGAGKSSIARGVERRLFDRGVLVQRLDGDDLRGGISADLEFTNRDRAENNRRVAEIARLSNESGLLVLACLISPRAEDRSVARDIVGKERWVEIHVAATLDTCEARDPKGLYRKARSGELSRFTGVSAPYEEPENPSLRIETDHATLDECIDRVVDFIEPYLGIPSS